MHTVLSRCGSQQQIVPAPIPAPATAPTLTPIPAPMAGPVGHSCFQAAMAFLPRIQKMAGIEGDAIDQESFAKCAKKGIKKAANAEFKQAFNHMHKGAMVGQAAAGFVNKKTGLSKIRRHTQMLAEEQLYELRYVEIAGGLRDRGSKKRVIPLGGAYAAAFTTNASGAQLFQRYMRQNRKHKWLFVVAGRSAPFHVRHSTPRPEEQDSDSDSDSDPDPDSDEVFTVMVGSSESNVAVLELQVDAVSGGSS